MAPSKSGCVSAFTCILIALLFNGAHAAIASTMYGWGENNWGQLGVGDRFVKKTPIPLPSFDSLNITTVKVAEGYAFFTASNGSIYYQGNNVYGQLANGNQTSTPSSATALSRSLNSSVLISPGGESVNGLIVSGANAGTLLGWGRNAGYVLKGISGEQKYPNVQTASASYGFGGMVRQVATASDTTFVLLNNGTVWAAGVGSFGLLGIGTLEPRYSFVEVDFFRTNNIVIDRFIDGQSDHICVLAVNGSLFCWGKNLGGQLGLQDTADRYFPTRVTFFDDEGYILYKVRLGANHTVALTCGGTVFTWGTNDNGQQGQGTTNGAIYPRPEKTVLLSTYKIVDIEAGKSQTFARTDSGKWFVWGGGLTGALGFASLSNVAQPTENPLLSSFTKIFSSSQSTTMYGWTGIPFTRRDVCPTLVDECVQQTHNCSTLSTCADTEVSYKCVCPNGWIGDGHTIESGGSSCVDATVCVGGNNNCVPDAECVPVGDNRNYWCACPVGHEGDGMKSTSGGTGCSDIDECAVGGYCSANAACTNSVGGYSCVCQNGFFGDGYTNGTDCTVECDEGEYASNRTVCSPCPVGQWNNKTAVTQCSMCPVGTYNAFEGAISDSACVACPDGMYAPSGMGFCYPCPYGQTTRPLIETGFRASPASCYDCPAGTYGYYGQCLPCNPGSYSNVIGASKCPHCPPGHFSSDPGSTTCSVCGPGTYSRGNAPQCSQCAAGFFSTGSNNSDCQRCPRGTSTNGLRGQNSCTSCLKGQFQSKLGALYCTDCPKGFYANTTGSAQCERCPAGSYTPTAGYDKCIECPANSIAPSVTSDSCDICLPGTVSRASGQQCVPCLAGYYRNATMSTCEVCPMGSFTNSIGSRSCFKCSPGSYTIAPASTFCRKCPLNTFSNDSTGYSSCAVCPSGKYSLGGASSCS